MKSRTQVEIENLKQKVRERERERESRIVKRSLLTVIFILTGAGLQGYKKS